MCCSGPILADKKSCNRQGPPCVVKTKARLRNNKGIAPAASFVPAEVSTATDQRENVVTPPPDGSTTWGWQRGGTSVGFTILAIAILAVVWKSAGPPKAKCSRRRSTLLAVVVSSFVPVVFVTVQLHVPSGTGFGAGNAAATEAPGAGEVDAVATDDPVDWAKRIDIFIPFSGMPSDTPSQYNAASIDLARDRYNGEIVYLLRSVAQHAPWVRRIWIAVNGPVHEPSSLAKHIPPSLRSRTRVVDRCAYMPAGTCPTRNSNSVGAFAHLLSGLSEYWIYVEDDIFLGRPVMPKDFYTDGKPRVWRKAATHGFFKGQTFHRIYKDPSVVDFTMPKSAAPSPHFWYPQLKTVCAATEQIYPEFYAFVGSHVNGRYSSLAKGISDKDNSQEECFMGWMNWVYLQSPARGVFHNIDKKRYEWWDEVWINQQRLARAAQNRPIFLNINDRFSKDVVTYRKQKKWFQETMEGMFPPPPKQPPPSSPCTDRTTALLSGIVYQSELVAELDRKTVSFLCERDGVDTFRHATATQNARPWTAGAASSDLPQSFWFSAYKERVAALTRAQVAKRKRAATAAAIRAVNAIAVLEAAGFRPAMVRGALIGIMRHGGWIDFGGAAYGAGYDTDPDGIMTDAEMARLLSMPHALATGAKSPFYPFAARQAAPDVTLDRYVSAHCDDPKRTKAFYRDLGVDLRTPNGFALVDPRDNNAVALDFSALHAWKGTAVDRPSSFSVVHIFFQRFDGFLFL